LALPAYGLVKPTEAGFAHLLGSLDLRMCPKDTSLSAPGLRMICVRHLQALHVFA
jgi:hypothetical protein